ncbi:hypothetical protein VTO42DRAFT_7537 [Malbranchea cinnamomea]
MGRRRRNSDSSQSKSGSDIARQTHTFIEERREPLQAVVLADCFETRFEPFTAEKPRCLLPLVNKPIIDYTLECLANAGIEEIILYSGAHSDQLERYLNGSKWRQPTSPFSKFRFIRSDSTSVGEVMRDLHGKHLMTGDFVVINGDVVSDYPIQEAIEIHKARRAKNKNAIMTMVLREIGANRRAKPSPITPVFVIDPSNDRCLHYEEINRRPRANSESSTRDHSTFLSIEPDLLSQFPELDIRNDLYDCGIDICTPEVLGLWADSFDYQTPRKHFLYGVLKDYELNGVTIHTHIIKDHYAARAHNIKAYDAVSKDIISRVAYPFCPDTNPGGRDRYTFKRTQGYRELHVAVSRQATIRSDSVVGYGSAVGDKSVVSTSVIGKNCRIGKNVILENAYIWDNVVIGDDTEIRHAIIADGVVIGTGCKVKPGSVISYGVKIADKMTVPEGSRITRLSRDAEVQTNPELVGVGGEGHEYVPDAEDEDGNTEDPVLSTLLYNLANLAMSNDSISTLASHEWDEDSSMRSRTGSFGTSVDENDVFHNDAVASIFDGLVDGLSSDVVHLELVGLRMSANASEHQVRKAVVAAFMKRILQLVDDESLSVGKAVNQVLSKYRGIFHRIMFDRDDDDKPDQVDLLLLFQKDIADRVKSGNYMLFIAKELYDLGIVDGEAFPQWWDHESSASTEALEKVRKQAQPFIDWLETAESESETESEDDDEEEDESEEEE